MPQERKEMEVDFIFFGGGDPGEVNAAIIVSAGALKFLRCKKAAERKFKNVCGKEKEMEMDGDREVGKEEKEGKR
jgi:hypothetical protein